MSAGLFCTTPAFTQDTLTVGEIYNFSVGDEFHYRTYDWVPGPEPLIESWIVRRVVSIDTVGQEMLYNMEYVDSSGTYGLDTIRVLLDQMDWKITDSIASQKNLYTNEPDTLWEPGHDSFWTVTRFRDTTFNNLRANYVEFHNGLPGYYEPDYYDGIYAEGLGFVEWEVASRGGGWFYKMVYYRKGNEQWGTPLNVAPLQQSRISIYPNPSSGILNIVPEKGQVSYHMTIYNTFGQVVHTFSGSGRTTVDLHTSGAYLIHIRFDHGKKLYERVIVSHRM